MHIKRSGAYFRVCDPLWENCCDASFSQRFGGRWNAPGSFPVLYLNRDIETARRNALRTYEGEAFGLFDLNPTARPHLQLVDIAPCHPVDAITTKGLAALDLPDSYPTNINHRKCQRLGARLRAENECGIACRSVAHETGEELALMRLELATKRQRLPFDEWFPENHGKDS